MGQNSELNFSVYVNLGARVWERENSNAFEYIYMVHVFSDGGPTPKVHTFPFFFGIILPFTLRDFLVIFHYFNAGDAY